MLNSSTMCMLFYMNQTYESSVTARVVLGGTPGNHRHYGVVVQMQEADLAVLFPQREEHCIEQFGKLGQEVNVATAGDLHRWKRL